MKKLLLNLLFTLYCFSGFMVLGLTILSPMMWGMIGAPPIWTAWILYPLALLYVITQNRCLQFFDKI